jgi:uncharacterized protein YgiM (DUF1202 family)
MSIRGKTLVVQGLAVGTLLCVAQSLHAEDAWVKQVKVDIHSGKGIAYPAVVAVPKGTKLTVLAHEGAWLKVSYNGQEGYVFGNYTSSKEVGADSGLSTALNGTQTSGMAAANAGKGLLEGDVTAYANTKSLDTSGLIRMAAQRNSVNPAEFDQFCQQGKVGTAKQ